MPSSGRDITRPPFKSTRIFKKEQTPTKKSSMQNSGTPTLQKKGSPKKSNTSDSAGNTSSVGAAKTVEAQGRAKSGGRGGGGGGGGSGNSGKQQTKAKSGGGGSSKGKPGKGSKAVTETESDDSRQLTPGPPPESGAARRNLHHHRQLSSRLQATNSGPPQPMRIPSLRRPSSFVAKRQSVFAGAFTGGNGNGGNGNGSLPPLGVQSYQKWANNGGKKPQAGGPSRSYYRASQTAFDGGGVQQQQQQQQQQFVPPQAPLDPSLNQTLLTLQSLVPAAVAYLEANPDIDQALGLLVSRFSPSLLFSSMQQQMFFQQQQQQPQQLQQQQSGLLPQMSNISRGGNVNGSGNRVGASNYRPGQTTGGQQQASRQMKQTSEAAWSKRKSDAVSATSGRGKSN